EPDQLFGDQSNPEIVHGDLAVRVCSIRLSVAADGEGGQGDDHQPRHAPPPSISRHGGHFGWAMPRSIVAAVIRLAAGRGGDILAAAMRHSRNNSAYNVGARSKAPADSREGPSPLPSDTETAHTPPCCLLRIQAPAWRSYVPLAPRSPQS